MRSRTTKEYHINTFGAVEQSDGSWLHSIDGQVYWYNKEGRIHREDGPAIVYPDSDIDWYLHGDEYEFDEWCTVVSISDESKMLLKLQYN
jgi:hypothetical protein